MHRGLLLALENTSTFTAKAQRRRLVACEKGHCQYTWFHYTCIRMKRAPKQFIWHYGRRCWCMSHFSVTLAWLWQLYNPMSMVVSCYQEDVVFTQIPPHSLLALYIPTTHTPRARMESMLQDPFSQNCVETHRGSACNGTLLGAAAWAPFGQRASRFEKNDIGRLKAPLLIPDTMYTAQRVALSQEEALCITLHRLAYPNRTSNLESFWEAVLSYFCSDKWPLWTYWGQLWRSSTRCQPHVAEYRYTGKLLTSKRCY